jgi:hypothetical protein
MIDLLATSGRMALACAVLAGVALAGATLPAAAQTAWTAVEGEARAILPKPERGSPFTGGTLACAGQIWTMTLATEIGVFVNGATGTVVLSVPRGDFPSKSVAVPAGVEITVPHMALEPLMASNRLTIRFEGGDTETRLPLAGSRRAVTAVDALCSPREMPLVNSVALTPFSSYIELARGLRKDDIRDFIDSTADIPTLKAGMVEIDAERRLLFAELCGSTWYYGISGCGLTGYAPVIGADQTKSEGWKLAFESEGVFLYVDPNTSVGGWPVLVSLPKRAGDVETRWVWTGEAYAISGTEIASPSEPDGEEEGSSD